MTGLYWVKPLVSVLLPASIIGWALWHRLKHHLPPDPVYRRPQLIVGARSHVRPVPPRLGRPFDWESDDGGDAA